MIRKASQKWEAFSFYNQILNVTFKIKTQYFSYL